MEHLQVTDPKIGNLYHLAWASNRGYVWRLIKINDDGTCNMKTPRTNKPLLAKLKDLRYTNADILKIQNQKRETSSVCQKSPYGGDFFGII